MELMEDKNFKILLNKDFVSKHFNNHYVFKLKFSDYNHLT